MLIASDYYGEANSLPAIRCSLQRCPLHLCGWLATRHSRTFRGSVCDQRRQTFRYLIAHCLSAARFAPVTYVTLPRWALTSRCSERRQRSDSIRGTKTPGNEPAFLSYRTRLGRTHVLADVICKLQLSKLAIGMRSARHTHVHLTRQQQRCARTETARGGTPRGN